MTTTTGEQPKQLEEPPVFFLDRTFGRYALAAMLREKGFILVTIFEEFEEAESKIADPVFISDCGLKNRVILTGDQHLPYNWSKEIVEARVAVFVTTNNNESPKVWGPRIISAQAGILKELARRTKPFTANISREGRVTQVRIYDGKKWKTITIGKKNPPHINKQKENLS